MNKITFKALELDFLGIDFAANGNFKIDYYNQKYNYNLESMLRKNFIKELQAPP
ncbi:hypothetical protein [Flavobacterium hydrophilum]|uniref:hypothetical protein n=1 Tax=Flavobacterium hydrophilum TaxID=2211445 RepID=UPI0014030E59|nr:hypothetical protein [Flavobacterium hydrophilum]